MAIEAPLLASKLAPMLYSLVSIVLGGGEVHHDPAVVELVAPAPAPAETENPNELPVIHKLGDYPVVKDSDLTDADRAAGKTKVEKGFEDTTDNGINDSPIEKSARAAAMIYFKGDVAEVERYMQWFHDHKQYYIDGSKTPIVDNHGYSKDGFRDVLVVEGEAVMGERGGGAKPVRVAFDQPEQATRGTYIASNGQKVNVDVYDKCANPQISHGPEDKPVPAPAPDTCAEGPKDKVDVKLVEGNTPSAKPIPIATVERTGLKPGEMWNDDGDGKAWQSAHSLDKGDEFPGLPDRAQVDKDIAEFKAKYGGEPPYIVYTLVDCDGKSVVVCYNTDKHSWNVFSDNTWDQNKDGRVTLDESIIDTKEELEAYLKDNAVKPK